jgi:hypothetical protein
MQGSDRTPPPDPSTLRKWRKQVAERIVALQKAGVSTSPPDGVLKTVRPNPLDLAWAAPEKERVQFGPEILPASDFETAMKPWRVEAWNGKGQGQMDAREHHSGAKSVRIDVPAASGNSAVTVLVWPQYGDGKLNISLEGERTYEFTAWVKTQNRNTLPELRVNVPTKAVATQRTGKGPANAEGWQRLWLQVQLKTPAQPNYLAIWVQGPGTVWLDDLSLREVIPPPLQITLDQKEYDEVDKIGMASFSIGRLAPDRILAVIENEQGQAVASLNSPFQAQHALSATNALLTLVSPVTVNHSRLIFNPSALSPGNYVVKISLLDAQGKKLAEKIAPFRRDSD